MNDPRLRLYRLQSGDTLVETGVPRSGNLWLEEGQLRFSDGSVIEPRTFVQRDPTGAVRHVFGEHCRESALDDWLYVEDVAFVRGDGLCTGSWSSVHRGASSSFACRRRGSCATASASQSPSRSEGAPMRRGGFDVRRVVRAVSAYQERRQADR